MKRWSIIAFAIFLNIYSNENNLSKLPLCSLHTHLEATQTEFEVLQRAKSKGITLDPNTFIFQRTYRYADFKPFADGYYGMCKVITAAHDFYDITLAELTRQAKQGAIYAELIASPDVVAPGTCGAPIDWKEMLTQVNSALKYATDTNLIRCAGLLTLVRTANTPETTQTANSYVTYLAENKDKLPYITGIHLSGAESIYPDCTPFIPAYDIARNAGLGLAAHAGEWDGNDGTTGADHMVQTLNDLKVSRFGHGNKCINNPALMEKLANTNTTLEICPTSNVCTCSCDTYQDHPLPTLWNYRSSRNSRIPINGYNSDDPTLFNTNIEKECDVLTRQFGMTDDDKLLMTTDGINAAFQPQAVKDHLHSIVTTYKKHKEHGPLPSSTWIGVLSRWMPWG